MSARDVPIVCVGGITIEQLPASAEPSDMPDSAIASGCVDFVLAPERIVIRS